VSEAAKKEEIYVIRSVRTSRIAPTDYCAQSRTGFASTVFEDTYVLHTTLRGDFPESGLNAATCFLHLGGLEDCSRLILLSHETSLAINPTRQATSNPPQPQCVVEEAIVRSAWILFAGMLAAKTTAPRIGAVDRSR
jgi:hypothetical protein